MNSSSSIAAERRSPFGDESAGLLATVISAFTWPSPGVWISSARQLMGNSPNTSGAPETRLLRLPVTTPLPEPALPMVLDCNAAALGNMAPPGSSKCPVRMLSTSTSQLHSVPYSCVQVPTRPYTTARFAAASERAKVRMVSAGIPHRPETFSAAKPATALSSNSRPATCAASRPR